MARKPKAQLHPDVAAALPVALAAMDDAPAPVRRGCRAIADAPSPKPSASGHEDTAAGGVGANADGATQAEAPHAATGCNAEGGLLGIKVRMDGHGEQPVEPGRSRLRLAKSRGALLPLTTPRPSTGSSGVVLGAPTCAYPSG